MFSRNLELKNDWVWEWTRQYHFTLLKKIFSRIIPRPMIILKKYSRLFTTYSIGRLGYPE
jgi:hypothetical protein